MSKEGDSSLYPIAVLIDELRNDDVQVGVRGKWEMTVLRRNTRPPFCSEALSLARLLKRMYTKFLRFITTP